MNKVKVAFIGCGKFAKAFHYSTLSEMDDVEIVAACDLNEELLMETSDTYGVKGRYTDYNEMFDKEDINLVYSIGDVDMMREVAQMTVKQKIPNLRWGEVGGYIIRCVGISCNPRTM